MRIIKCFQFDAVSSLIDIGDMHDMIIVVDKIDYISFKYRYNDFYVFDFGERFMIDVKTENHWDDLKNCIGEI